MCLTNSAMYGWKVLRKDSSEKGYALIDGSSLPTNGKWIKKRLGKDSYGRRRLKTLPLAWSHERRNIEGRYPVGFHVFLYKKDAIVYGKAREHHGGFKLIRVAIKGLLFIGTQKTTYNAGGTQFGKTVICEEMAFLGEEPMVE